MIPGSFLHEKEPGYEARVWVHVCVWLGDWGVRGVIIVVWREEMRMVWLFELTAMS